MKLFLILLGLSPLLALQDDLLVVAGMTDLSHSSLPFSPAIEDLSAADGNCGGCSKFVEKVRKLAANPKWNSISFEECPVDGDALCHLWKEEANRASLLRDIREGLCSHEICVKWRRCERSTCDSCQILLGGAATALSQNPEHLTAWFRSHLPPLCSGSEFAQKHVGVCSLDLASVTPESLNVMAGQSVSELALGMCKAVHECSADDDVFSTCTREDGHSTLPQMPVLKHVPGCAYVYKYVAGTKMTMAAMLQEVQEQEPENTRSRALVTIEADVAIDQIGRTEDGDEVFELIVHSASVDNDDEKYPITMSLNENPFYFVQSPSGSVKKVIFNDREAVEYLDIKRDIVNMFDFKATAHPASEEEHSDDGDGVTTMRYLQVRKPDTDSIEFHRSKKTLDFGSLSGLARSEQKSVDVDTTEGVVKAAVLHQKHSSGHLQSADLIHEGDHGGLNSFAFRAKSAARVSLVSKQCHSASEQHAASLLQFSSPEDVVAHVSGRTNLRGGALRVADIESVGNGRADDLPVIASSRVNDFAPALSRAKARFTPVGKSVQSWLVGIPKMVTATNSDPQLETSVDSLKQMISGDKSGRVAHLLGDMLTSRPLDAAFGARNFASDDRHPRLQSKAKSAILRALVASGDPASQTVLLEYVQRPETLKREKTFVVSSLMTTRHPTKDAAHFVHSLATASSNAPKSTEHALAASVVSAMAGRISEAHPYHTDARKMALSKLHAASLSKDIWGQELALVMLGNIGSRQDIGTISQYLKHGQRLLREQAATSLRRISGTDVTTLLGDRLVSEPHQMVRLALISSLTSRHAPRSFWSNIILRLKNGATTFPPLSRAVAQRLRDVLKTHHFDLSLKFLPKKKDLKVLEDFEEAEDSDDDDNDTHDALKMIEVGSIRDESSSQFLDTTSLDVASMWGEERCHNSGEKESFDFDTDKHFSFGAKNFASTFETAMFGKGFGTDGSNWCATLGGEATNSLEILGKKFEVFDFKAETQYDSAHPNGTARPNLVVFGYQIALPQTDVTPETGGSLAAPSLLCDAIDTLVIYPPPNAPEGEPPALPAESGGSEDGWQSFSQEVSVRWRVLTLRFTTSLNFKASVFFEQCKSASPGHFVGGLKPHASVKTTVEGGAELGLIGSGVGLSMDVFTGELVLSATFEINEDKTQKMNEANAVTSVVDKGIAIHLNWQAISGKLYAFARALSNTKPLFAMCFPSHVTGIPIDLQVEPASLQSDWNRVDEIPDEFAGKFDEQRGKRDDSVPEADYHKLINTCNLGSGYFYNGIRTIYDHCVDQDGEDIDCSSVHSPPSPPEVPEPEQPEPETPEAPLEPTPIPEPEEHEVIVDDRDAYPYIPDEDSLRIARKNAERERDMAREAERKVEEEKEHETRKENREAESARTKIGSTTYKQGMLDRDNSRKAGRRVEDRIAKDSRGLKSLESEEEKNASDEQKEVEDSNEEIREDVDQLDNKTERRDEREQLRRASRRDRESGDSTLGIMERMGERKGERNLRQKERRNERRVARRARGENSGDEFDSLFEREERLNAREFDKVEGERSSARERKSVRRDFNREKEGQSELKDLRQAVGNDADGGRRQRELRRFEKVAKETVGTGRGARKTIARLGEDISRGGQRQEKVRRDVDSQLKRSVNSADRNEKQSEQFGTLKRVIRQEERSSQREREVKSLEQSVQADGRKDKSTAKRQKDRVLGQISKDERRDTNRRRASELVNAERKSKDAVTRDETRGSRRVEKIARRNEDRQRRERDFSGAAQELNRDDEAEEEGASDVRKFAASARREEEAVVSETGRRSRRANRRETDEIDQGVREVAQAARQRGEEDSNDDDEVLDEVAVAAKKAKLARSNLLSLMHHPDIQSDIAAPVQQQVEELAQKAASSPLPGEDSDSTTDTAPESEEPEERPVRKARSDSRGNRTQRPPKVKSNNKRSVRRNAKPAIDFLSMNKGSKKQKLSESWKKEERQKVLGQFANRAVGLYAGARHMYKQGTEMDEYEAKVMVKARRVWDTASKYFAQFEKYRQEARKLIATVKAGSVKLRQYSARAQKWSKSASGTENSINANRKNVRRLAGAAKKLRGKFRVAKKMMDNWQTEADRDSAEAKNALNVLDGKAAFRKFGTNK